MSRAISDLLAQVPAGQSRTFAAPLKDEAEARFVEVRFDHKYGPPLDWSNRPEFTQLPWMGTRAKPRIGLGKLVEPEISFEKATGKMVDFYSTGTAAFIISKRLRSLIEDLDPDSLEVRLVRISTRDGHADYFMVMPYRNISAVDPDQTDFKVEDTPLGNIFVRKVLFTNGAVFRKGVLDGMHNFSDIDLPDLWFWSRELVYQAKIAGIRGLYTRYPGKITGEIDHL